MSPQEDLLARVQKDPNYQELVRRRNRISLSFFSFTFIIYAAFIITLAYNPSLFGRSIEGMTMSIGVFLGIIVVISATLLVSLYVYVSNKVFDPLLEKVLQEVDQ